MLRLNIILISCFIASAPQTSNAQEDEYKCVIGRVSLANGDTGHVYDMLKKAYVGKDFTVDRKTGIMTGALKNSYRTKPEVIDYGSSENAFKVITSMRVEQGIGYGSNIYALNINEYIDSKKKPFAFLDNDSVFLGTCEHL